MMSAPSSSRPHIPQIASTSVVEHAVAHIEAGLQLTTLHAPIFGNSREPSIDFPVATGCSCRSKSCEIRNRGKHPIRVKWQKNTLTDPVAARDEIMGCAFVPNLGLVLGLQPSGSYILAIDVDEEQRFLVLQEEYGPLPETARCDSGRGYRLFFTIPDETPRERLGNINGIPDRKIPGVDLKVAGGQVVIEPSWHPSGVRYRWTRSGEIAELPPNWVLAILKKPDTPKWTTKYTPQSMKTDARAQKRGEGYLQSAVISDAGLMARTGSGLRNSTLYAALCRLLPLAHGLLLPGGHGYVVRELASAAKAAGLHDREIRTTVASAERWMQESGAVRVPFALTEADSEAPVETSPATPTAPPLPPLPPELAAIDLIKVDDKPANVATNVARLLSEHPIWQGGPRYDEFTQRVEWSVSFPAPLNRLVRPSPVLIDADEIAIQAWLLTLHRSHRLRVGVDVVSDGVRQAARWARFDSLRARIAMLPVWDGELRLNTWLSVYAGAPNTLVTRTFGRRWLISAMARALSPGCVADGVLVLEGEQGIGKNRLITSLFGDAPWVQSIGAYRVGHDIEADRIAGSAWIVHDDEMGTRRSEVDSLKAWISRREDTYRLPYERNLQTRPRRAILVCSTNRAQYLLDDRNRRFWPVRCGLIDWEGAGRDGEKILAEALCAYLAGEIWTISPTEPEIWGAVQVEQDGRRMVDSLTEGVRQYIANPKCPTDIRVYDLADSLGIPPERRDRTLEMRLSTALREAGYERVRAGGEIRTYVYRRRGGPKPFAF